MPSSTSFSPAGRRNPLLDLWRGVALVDMAWVHLATYPIGMPDWAAMWIGEHSRFAAGCFVLLSGLTVRTVFGSKLGAGGDPARQATRSLLRRALLLAAIDRLTCIAFAGIERFTLDPSRSSPDSFGELLSLAMFGSPGVTGGLLLLYSLLLSAMPLVERLRQRVGDGALLALSLSIFGVANAGNTAHFPPWTFPFAHWQPLFILGYVAAPWIDRLRGADGAFSAGWRALVTAACAAVFTLRSGAALGVEWLPELNFAKVPLNAWELFWYACVSVLVLTWSGWLHDVSAPFRRCTAWLQRLGQWSLLIYVAHLLLELPIIAFLTRFDPSPAMRATMLPLIAVAMSCVAILAERFDRWVPARTTPVSLVRRILPPAGTTGVGVALASFVCILFLRLDGAPAPVEVSQPDESIEMTLDDLALSDDVGVTPVDLEWYGNGESDDEPAAEELPSDDELYSIEQ